MPHADPDSDSNSDCKPKGYIVLCRTFHTAQSQIQNSSQLEGTGIELELGSVGVIKPQYLKGQSVHSVHTM